MTVSGWVIGGVPAPEIGADRHAVPRRPTFTGARFARRERAAGRRAAVAGERGTACLGRDVYCAWSLSGRLQHEAGDSPRAPVPAVTSPPPWTSPEPALPSRGLGCTRWLLAQRAGSLGDVVRGERRHVGTVERIHAPVLGARQPQGLAVERLFEQRAGEARVAGLLTGAEATENAAERRFGARLQRVLVLGQDESKDRFEFVRRVV